MWLHILLSLLVLGFIFVLLIKRFVYFSPTYDFLAPKDTFTDVYEGDLHAWFRKGSPKDVILFCHGNAGNLSYRQDKLIELAKTGYSVLIFDYSGFGRSRGVPNEQLCYANACMFFDFLKNAGFTNIIPYGESLGASVAMYVARKYNLKKVILESPLPGIKYLLRSKYPKLSFLSVIFNEFDTVAFISGYKGQSLVLHCVNDEVVPYASVQDLKTQATFFADMDGSHNNALIPWDTVRKFVLG